MKYSVPNTKKKKRFEIDNFLGIDLTTAANSVYKNRSPYCPNMIRDTVGKVKKRDGIALVKTFSDAGDGNINGVHFLYGSTTKKLIHTGTNIYLDGETPSLLYSSAADHISVSKQMGGKLWILDGTTYLVFDGTTVRPVSEIAYVPTILIARAPSGGGTTLDEVNLIQVQKRVKFAGTAGDTVYWLPHNNITSVDLVQVMDSGGNMITKTVGTDYTVNTTTGVVTFTSAPGESPITGEDNVYVTYSKTISGYADKINKCDISVLYGMNGARDRLFVSGNSDYPNYDYYSAMNDPTYFGDLGYSVVGQDDSAIINYSIVDDYLVTHKNEAENGANANLRKGELYDSKVVFTSQGSYQTAGALAKHSFSILQNEPMYVTVENNISAVTPSDVLGERFSQERSYYINGLVGNDHGLKNESLEDAFACVFEGFYFLATGNNIYILDGMQPTPQEKNRPYSTRQYEGYFFPDVSARIMWSEDGELYFGTTDGKIKKFDKGVYNDEGTAITAYWDTPEISGDSFEAKKTFDYVGCVLASAVRTAVKVSAKEQGIWNEIIAYNNEAQYFDWNDIDFNNFTFSTDTSPHTLGQKIKIKNVDKSQFRFENSRLNEPFGIYKALIRYSEGSDYRK